jgi:hypothetical protein
VGSSLARTGSGVNAGVLAVLLDSVTGALSSRVTGEAVSSSPGGPGVAGGTGRGRPLDVGPGRPLPLEVCRIELSWGRPLGVASRGFFFLSGPVRPAVMKSQQKYVTIPMPATMAVMMACRRFRETAEDPFSIIEKSAKKKKIAAKIRAEGKEEDLHVTRV